ncbi:hypothetical protein ANCDUO_05494 [Ancylostoma duodenale]|uniref:DDE Tnp4 domain-containing protein n=1 Tax=Ancylostoma duodenale TaxID=51022 RepID=A0A0C2D3X5_9BILA|nr:hypothetical protein ANCDUO_05494 [Ancylostoma duodenale]
MPHQYSTANQPREPLLLPKSLLCGEYRSRRRRAGPVYLYNCGFAGKHHDPFIWRNSLACQEFEEGRARRGYRLSGDAGFANSSSIMTPYRRGVARADRTKKNSNKEHAKCRSVVEQAFGALKRRFWVLNNITRIEPLKMQKLIKECVLLYNTGIYLGTHRGQTVPLRVRGVMTHPPSNTSVREYVTANL